MIRKRVGFMKMSANVHHRRRKKKLLPIFSAKFICQACRGFIRCSCTLKSGSATTAEDVNKLMSEHQSGFTILADNFFYIMEKKKIKFLSVQQEFYTNFDDKNGHRLYNRP